MTANHIVIVYNENHYGQKEKLRGRFRGRTARCLRAMSDVLARPGNARENCTSVQPPRTE